ncbi:hypothetical protein GE061_016660 [Apolygus lucorum]|uniref:Uncharacterized protein n=1 Tax=Apolygus lucorum TaxID=248454 RepID=A0A6A4JZN7_APOLU|nr:hypothetical protein GE061_016660 [Apolygus lucorum]
MTEENEIGFEPIALDACCNLQKCINQIPNVMHENDPDKYRALRPTMLWLRDEGQLMKGISLKVRREALKEQITREYDENKEALLRIGMGFISTHP